LVACNTAVAPNIETYMPYSLGVDFTNNSSQIFRAQNSKPFFFDKWLSDLANIDLQLQPLTLLVKLNSVFFAERHTPVSFSLAKKFGEINPRWLRLNLKG
jgi:hypothetical protein